MATKLRKVKKIRERIVRHENIVETDRADNSLIDLSFQSKNRPERHAWIGCYKRKSLFVDLEDWNDETRFDNVVLTFTGSVDTTVAIVVKWLDGESVDNIVLRNVIVEYRKIK